MLKTNSKIIPVGERGTYKFRSKDLTVRFGNAFEIEKTFKETNDKLYEEIKKLMEENLKKLVK